MSNDELLPELLREVAKIGANQEHLMGDMTDIKNSLKELRADNCKRDDRIRKIENRQANEDGQHKAVLGVLSFGAALAASVITAFISWILSG